MLILSTASQAQWIESQGQATIRDGDKQYAKQRALQQAIKHALIYSGANISNVQQVVDGVLTSQSTQLVSNGEIQQIEIIDENYSNDKVSLTVRLNVYAKERVCLSSDFKKSLAVTQFPIVRREHAVVGELYHLGKAASQQLVSLLNELSNSTLVRPFYQATIDNTGYFEQQLRQDNRLISSVAESSDSQYVLLGRITDLQLAEQPTPEWRAWAGNHYGRYFGVEISVYNSQTFEQILNKTYHSTGEWTFNQRQPVDVFSAQFWHQPFGETVTDELTKAVADIQEALGCQPLNGVIVQKQQNSVTFNVGSQHGLRKGQIFTLAYQHFFIGKNGQRVPQTITSPFEVVIEQVFPNSAIGRSVGNALLANIQVGDIVEMTTWHEEEALDEDE